MQSKPSLTGPLADNRNLLIFREGVEQIERVLCAKEDQDYDPRTDLFTVTAN